MAVYYRYRSEVETFSVPVPGPTVSVGELKGLIMGSARYGNLRHGQTIVLFKSLAGEEQYDDDAKPVPLYSTVIACRLPAWPIKTTVMVPASSPLIPRSEQPPHGSPPSSATSSASPAARSPAAPPPSIPADLHCKICSNVMADAVVASKCCFWSYCDRCVSDRIAETSGCACGAPAHSNELIPNPTVRKTIANQLAALDATENARGSIGSNATPPQDASHKKRGTVSKHMDGSSSSPTYKTTTGMENHEPHRAILLPRHHDRKRTDREDRRQQECSFKRRCGIAKTRGTRSLVALL